MGSETQLNTLFKELDGLGRNNHDLRNELITKLMGVAKDMDLDPKNMRASELESRLGVISSIDSLMKNQEAAKVNNIKLNLQQQSDELESDHSSKVLDLLRLLAPGSVPKASAGEPVDLEKADSAIEERIKEEGCEISDAEKSKISVGE